jgi:hypothetical protein
LSEGTDRINHLDPSHFIQNICLSKDDEVSIRRQISAIYMALFNYWVSIRYYMHEEKGKGGRGVDDDFTLVQFDKALNSMNLQRECVYLSVSRNSVDHRIKNPAEKVYLPATSTNYTEIKIDINRLARCKESATNVLEKLNSQINDSTL